MVTCRESNIKQFITRSFSKKNNFGTKTGNKSAITQTKLARLFFTKLRQTLLSYTSVVHTFHLIIDHFEGKLSLDAGGLICEKGEMCICI